MSAPPPAERRTILFVVPRFHTNLHGATRALISAGHRVAIFATATARLEDHSHLVPRIFGADATVRDVASALDEVGPDLVILRKAPPLSRQVGAAARRRGIPVWLYSLQPLDRPTPHVARLKAWWRFRARRRITPVPGVASGTRAERFASLLPWPVDGSPRPAPRAPGPVRILCVGKLSQPRKNQHLLIEALDALPPGLDWTLTLAGATDDRVGGADPAHAQHLAARAAQGPPARRVTIRPDIPFDEMPELYRQHDLCVLPASGEPLGMAPLEAMAHGCVPVIAGDAGAAGFVTHGRDGFRVDMSQSGALGSVLSTLLADPERIPEISDAAARTAARTFSTEAFLERFDALLTSGD